MKKSENNNRQNEKGHNHNHDHSHEHNHGNNMVKFYLVGLIAFVLGYLLKDNYGVISNILFLGTVIFAGSHVIIEGIVNTIVNSRNEKKFMPNIHFLMTLAAIGSILIGGYEESAMLILIFAGAHFLEEYVDGKSRKEITNLLKLNPLNARLLLKDNAIKKVPVDTLEIGDKLQVLNGDQIPIDGFVLSGNALVNESSINGESLPKEKTVGDKVFASTLNDGESFIMEVTTKSNETAFAKILKLVNDSQNSLTKTATTLQRLEPKYVTFVLALFPLVLFMGVYVFNWGWQLSLYRSLVYLISVSPCALAASAIPVTLATISNLSKQGILVKGGSYLSVLSEIKAIAFDKTGTLTKGKPIVTDYYFTDDENKLISVVVAMEKQSNHPLARAIVERFTASEELDIKVENKIGEGVVAEYLGDKYNIAKPTVFENYNNKFFEEKNKLEQEGKTVVFVSKNQEIIGLVAFMDVPRDEAKRVINYFKQQGIHTTMITGDSQTTGKEVGKLVGINEVEANVMPENKVSVINRKKHELGNVVMVGDGINDTPSLSAADVGIAMGSGTDAAIEIADVVLMNNDLTKLTYAHKMSLKMRKITYQNIIFAMCVIIMLVILNFLGRMDITFGVILHEGSTLVVILNALRMLKGVDN
jgi:heavy metal translocating P-type ATPase